MKLARIALSLSVALLATVALASNAQPAFDALKGLQGDWSGQAMGHEVQVTFRVTSGGSAIMSEIHGSEDMVTMFHMDGERLMMTHYCGAGNQPRMIGTPSSDGKTITFNFLDATNLLSSQPGHMQRLTVNILDANHHIETWEFQGSDGKTEQHEMFDLRRTK